MTSQIDTYSSYPPIIVIGMHRSGTSVVTDILESLGLFMGHRKDKNNESIYFNDLNSWLMRQSGGSWDRPLPIKELVEDDRVLEVLLDYLDITLCSTRSISYLGMLKYLKYRSLRRIDVPWGWKDPRNTFTLPLWLKLFPDAKVIHIYRHGVDVANSLKVRRDISLSREIKRYYKAKNLYRVFKKNRGFSGIGRCSSIEGCFSLWEEYIDEAKLQIGNMDKNRVYEIKYEVFLEEPVKTIEDLVLFCALKKNDNIIEKSAKRIDRSRAYAYKSDEGLLDFSKEVEGKLKVFEY